MPDTATIDPSLPAQSAIPLTGIVVLMLIPVVAYALWGDYFERFIDRMRSEHEKFEEIEELYRVRLNGLFAILAEAVIFLGAGPARKDHAVVCGTLAFATVATTLFLQSRFERKIRTETNPKTRRKHAKSAIVACTWSVLAGALYLAVFAVAVVVCTLPAALIKVPTAASVLMLMIGIASGVMGGLCASFGLAPFFVRKIFGAERITDTPRVEELDRIFDESGVERPGYWTIQPGQYHSAGAMVAGFRSGRGVFKPALFISKRAIDGLSPAELRSVVLHEVSHLQLRHLRKRFIFSSGLVICASLLTGTLVQLIEAVSREPQLGGLAGCISLVAAFALALRAMAQQTRFQEIQADIHSIEKLGSKLDDLASALRKLDRLNGILPFRKEPGAMMLASGHPETELRIKILAKYFERKSPQTGQTGESPGEKAA